MLKSEKSIPDDITMFLGRILLRIESEFGDGEEPSAKLDTLIHVLQLESHYDRLDPSQQVKKDEQWMNILFFPVYFAFIKTNLSETSRCFNSVVQEDLGIFLMKFTRYWKKPIPRGVLGSRKLLDLVAAIKNNQFAICDEEASNCDIGSALYLDQSLLNHSCKPNAFPVFNGTNLIIKALEKIAPGEEIKIAYTDTKAVTEDRREYLNSIYR